MVTGAYGRQWISPKASDAFEAHLLEGDLHSMKGNLNESMRVYKQIESHNQIAKRRIAIAKRQLKKAINANATLTVADELSIGFIDWYQGFENDSDSILSLFYDAGLSPRLSSVNDADILVCGAYGNQLVNDKRLSEDKLVILFTGENICPSYDIHDFSISTRTRSYCGKNVRYPQWFSELKLGKEEIHFRNYGEFEHRQTRRRDIAISAIYNNSTPEREEMLYLLRQYFGEENVRIFGSQRCGHINKLDILAKSIINVCFENSLGEGYVTEKLLHAKIMGCNALYWGDQACAMDFNQEDVFNIRDANTSDDIIEWCRKRINTPPPPPPPCVKLVDRSLFNLVPSHNHIYSHINAWSKIVLGWRKWG